MPGIPVNKPSHVNGPRRIKTQTYKNAEAPGSAKKAARNDMVTKEIQVSFDIFLKISIIVFLI